MQVLKKELKVGSRAPAFRLPDGNGNIVSLNDLKGKWVVLYFYPRDNTPGCTLEAIDFTARKKDFGKLNAVIIGVSPDSQKSHCSFSEKHDISVTLLSDTETKALESYGVWRKKQQYGREYMGVVRTTCLIDPAGKVVRLWNNVKVKGHAEEVLKDLRALQS